MKIPNLAQSLCLLFLAQACVGINIVLSKILLSHLNPIIMLTIRFSIASVIMTLLLIRSDASNKFELNFTLKDWLVLCAKGLGAGVFFNFIMLSGLHFTDANSAGLISSLLPAIIILLNITFFKQKLTQKMLIAISISVVGLVLINLSASGENTKNALFGNLLVLLSLVPDGLYYALSKYYPIKINSTLKILLLNILNLPFLYLAIAFMPAEYWKVITLHDWIIMLCGIGPTSCLFFIFWQQGIRNIDSAYAALSTAFMPVTTVILAWLILGEALSLNKFIGMILVVLAIISYARR